MRLATIGWCPENPRVVGKWFPTLDGLLAYQLLGHGALSADNGKL